MDYATLTDNKGRKADFRNTIIIMTSNAGARDIGKNLVGFGRESLNLNAMDEETFKIFLEYHLSTCERPELLGAGAHTLDILTKE